MQPNTDPNTVMRRMYRQFSPTVNEKQEDGEAPRKTYISSISSNTPDEYRQWDYSRRRDVIVREILLHQPENVDLMRLNEGANVLFNHNWGDYIGRTKRAWVDGEKAWAEFIFGENESAKEKQRDVDNQVLRQVSIGWRPLEYELHESESEPDADGVRTLIYEYLITRWEILEFSIVTVPADPTVGIALRSVGMECYNQAQLKSLHTTHPKKEKIP